MISYKRFSVVFGAVLLATIVTACGGPQVKPATQLIWPLPPDEPRIKLVQVISGPDDLGLGQGSISEAIFGEEKEFNFKKPFSVTADDEGRIFVSDIGKVLVFDQTQKKIYEFGTTGAVQLRVPMGLAVSSDGTLFVADLAMDRVFAFDRKGNVLMSYGSSEDLTNPVAVAVDDARKRVYVADSKKHFVKAYSRTGQTLFTIGERGKEEGKFNYPDALTVDGKGNIYVADCGNFRVQIFDSNGKFIRTFGKVGSGGGAFSRPKGIALDSEGHIYVSDSGFNNVQIFDNTGQLLMAFGSTGSNPGFFTLIEGIAIDKKDKIYAVDQLGYRLNVYQYLSEEYKKTHPEAVSSETK